MSFKLLAADFQSGDDVYCEVVDQASGVAVEIGGDYTARIITITSNEGVTGTLSFLDCSALFHWATCCVDVEVLSASVVGGIGGGAAPGRHGDRIPVQLRRFLLEQHNDEPFGLDDDYD